MRVHMMVGLLAAMLSSAALASETIPVPKELKAFIPKGYGLILDQTGDINRDGLTDHILVIQNQDENVDEDRQRELLILVGQADGSLKLAKRAVGGLLCSYCGGMFGDPLSEIKIDKSGFTISHYGGARGRWGYASSFGWSRIDQTWQLIKFTISSHDTLRENSYREKNYVPPKDYGKIAIDEFNLHQFAQEMEEKKKK